MHNLRQNKSYCSGSYPFLYCRILCNGTDALSECMNKKYDKCKVSSNVQGQCYHSAGGHSLKAVCISGGTSVAFSIYATTADCTGPVSNVTQITDLCQQGGGGQYFVKLECQ